MRKFLHIVLSIVGFVSLAQTPIISYQFDGTVKDSQGNVDGVLVNGGTFGADRFGASSSALSLDGINQYLSLDNGGVAIVSTGQISLAGWFNSNDFSNTQFILSIPELIVFINDSGFPGMAPQDGISSSPVISSVAIGKSEWFHLAATYDGSVAKIYVNGVETGSSKQDKTLSSAKGITNLGANVNNSNVFPGLIDEVSFFDFALNDAEILAIYQKRSFVTTWGINKADETITIPTTGTGYNYRVDWGDGTIESGFTGDATHLYALPGNYSVSISGDFPRIYFASGNISDPNNLAITSIDQWGDIDWQSMEGSFTFCPNLKYNATDAPNLTNVTDLFRMFALTGIASPDLNNWNVSTITDMRAVFSTTSFTGDISSWNVSNVTNAFGMFQSSSFNGDVSGWDVSSMTDFGQMFLNSPFNQDLSAWDISAATNMAGMFNNSEMSLENYDATLIGWATLEGAEVKVPTFLSFGAEGISYCNSVSERADLIGIYSWTIDGDDENCFVAQYSFDGDAIDTSGNGREGTVNGATLTSDRFGNADQAYSFDGVDDFISLPIQTDELGDVFTITAWASLSKANQASNQIQGIVSSALDATDGGVVLGIQALSGGDRARGIINTNTQFHIVDNDEFYVPTSDWRFYSLSYDGTNLTLYEDGALIDTELVSGLVDGAGSLKIGTNLFHESEGGYFGGSIDDVAIYITALTANEIGELYASESNVIVSYSFSGDASDKSGNGIDGTVNGASLTADRFGNANEAYSFDGVDDFISTPTLIETPGNITISAWFYYPEGEGNGTNQILEINGAAALAILDDSFQTVLQLNGNFETASIAATSDEWHLGVLTYDGTSFKSYLDGVLFAESAFSGPITYSGVSQLFFASNGSSFFNGNIDDVAIYNYALSEDEIQEIYTEKDWPIQSIQVTGTALTGNANSEVKAMSSVAGTYYTSAYLYDGSIRFQANETSEINWGDNEPNGVVDQDGTSITVTEGLYAIQFSPFNDTYSITEITTVGFIGSARTGDNTGWQAPDTDMYQSGNGIYTLRTQLYTLDAGGSSAWKMRANDTWDLMDWGGGDGTLEIFGDNVLLDNSGVYNITADLNNLTYEIAINEPALTAFRLAGEASQGVIDEIEESVSLDLGQGFDISAMIAEFTLTDGASATVNGQVQVSGVTVNDFTNPVVYVITSTDGSVSNWIVTVDQAGADGLIVYYPFTGNAEDQINGYNGTLNGNVVLTADRFGNVDQAYSFGGSVDFIQTDFTPTSDQAFSISYWVYWDEVVDEFKEMLGFSTQDNSITTYFGVADNSQNNDLRARSLLGISLPVQQWSHLVFTYDGVGNFECFLDNESVYTQSNLPDYKFGPLTIGAFSRNGDESWNGDLDDIRFYDRAISEEEINELYRENGWIPEQGAVIAQYSYTSNADDESGLGRNGILGNGSNDDNSPNLTTDRFGSANNAYQYDGDDYITYTGTTDLNLGDQMTVAAWINSSTIASGEPGILTNITDGNGGFDFKLSGNNEIKGLKAEVFGDSNQGENNTFLIIGELLTNRWYHVAFTYSRNGSLILYADGIEIGSIATPDNPINLSIGDFISGQNLTGTIDELVIYDEALSAESIYNLYYNSAPLSSENELISFSIKEETQPLLNGLTSIGSYEDSWFYISESAALWNDAKTIAESLGGYLAVINSQEENDFIQNNISTNAFIGLSDALVEGDFKWVDGSVLNYTNWNQADGTNPEPNGGTLENFVEFLFTDSGTWNDLNDEERPFIIEVPFNEALINATNKTISLEVPLNTDLSSLAPYFEVSDKATVKINSTIQESGVTSNDYTNAVIYEIIAEDMTSDNWVVSVTKNLVEGDSLALLALYNATDGDNWTPKKWDLNQPMSTWDGISINANNRVVSISLSENNLVGSIPTEISNLSSLARLELGGNQLTGSIPVELGNLTNLTDLYLYNNLLSGSIPSTLGQLSTLFFLGLDGNDLSGEIPNELGDLSLMVVFDLSRNNLSGSIPATLSNMSSGGNLQGVYLSENELTGNIPIEFGNLGASMRNLIIGSNQLIGEIPAELGNLANLNNLSLEGNNLSGAIPTELGSLTNLNSLHLGNNNLTGDIPSSFVNLIGLSSLGLEINQLSSIPDLTSLPFDEEGLVVVNNKIGFTDIITNLSITNFSFENQVLDESESILVTTGTPVTLSTSEDHPNTSYQWAKDGNNITADGNNATYITDEEGTYTVVMTNTSVPGLTITREPYILSGIDATEFLSFTFDGVETTTTLDPVNSEIDLSLPFESSNISSLVAVFEISAGASADIGGTAQTSGVTENDFSNDVTYTVTAQDETTTENWTVKITNANNDIESFDIVDQIGDEIIDANAHTVSLTMPFGTDLTALTPSIVISANATIDPASDTPQNFTNPVVYTVTSQSGVAQEWVVTVTNKENSFPTDITISNNSIDENSPIGTTIGVLSTIDADTEDTHTYSLTVGGSSSFFEIVNDELISVNVFDFENVSSYTIEVTTDDGKGGDYSEEIIISINDIDETTNQAPFVSVFIPDQLVEIGTGEFALTLEANTFGDPNGDALTLSATKNDGSALPSWLLFDSGSETFTGTASTTDEDVTIRVTATDGGGLSVFDDFSVDIQILNAAPSIADQMYSVDENTTNGSSIATIVATDDDEDALTYTITSGNESEAFAINSGSGELTVADETLLNFEAGTTSYVLTIEVNDGVVSISATITINVNNVNETTLFSLAGTNPSSNAKEDFSVSVTITDDDAITGVKLYTKKVAGASFTPSANISAGSNNDYTQMINGATAMDNIGVEYFFELEDEFGKIQSDTLIVSTQVGSAETSISNVPRGTTQKDYSILAFPFESVSVSTVFGDLGDYDENWRLLSYSNGSYRDVQSGNVTPGVGYWFITKETATINTGGQSVSIEDGVYKIDIVPSSFTDEGAGYALIGNPFQGQLDWTAVINHNQSKNIITDEVSDELIGYVNGNFTGQTSLSSMEGAFIQSSSRISNFEIPISAVSNAGRLSLNKSYPKETYIDDQSWNLGLYFNTSSYDYLVGGIGIDVNAKDTWDNQDMAVLPRLELYLDLLFKDGSTRSIKKTDDFKSWSFTVRNNLPEEMIDMTWDVPVSSNKTIILVDGASQKIYDLKETKSIQLNNNSSVTHQLYYGDKETIFENLDVGFDAYYGSYPNPVKDVMTIEMFGSSLKKVSLSLVGLGGKTYHIGSMELYEGLNKEMINLDTYLVPAGIYFLTIDDEVVTKILKR